MDPSLTGKVTVIMFRAQHTELPEANIGSIIKLRANRPLDLTHQRSAEIMAYYAEHLRNWWNNIENIYSALQTSRKLINIADIPGPNVFFDIIAEIVEIHRVELITELYITDYTCNELLCNNNFVWRLPDGLNPSNVLQISLWTNM